MVHLDSTSSACLEMLSKFYRRWELNIGPCDLQLWTSLSLTMVFIMDKLSCVDTRSITEQAGQQLV